MKNRRGGGEGGEGRDVEVGGILLRMPRPITPPPRSLETCWNVAGVTIPPFLFPLIIYIYTHVFFNNPFLFRLHTFRVDPRNDENGREDGIQGQRGGFEKILSEQSSEQR